MALNNRTIATAQPGARIWDDQVRGLCLRVSATGRKAFYLVYRTRAGQQRGPKLAGIEVMTLAQARDAAREMLAKVALGGDPVAEWRAEHAAPTVAELGARWLADHEASIKPRTLKLYRDVLTNRVLPALGSLKAAAVQHEDVGRLHKSMADTPTMANRTLAALSCMFTYAEKHRLRPPGSNPCAHVRRYRETKRRRYMSRGEAPQIAAALARYETTRHRAVAFVYLLILSGARPDEIAGAKPEWLECVGDGGVLRLPDSKTGSRSVYLPPQVMRVLAAIPPAGGTLLGIKSPKSLWDRVRVEAGTPDLRLYDLRHTFASAALDAGYSLAQIGELLGHASTQTTKRYAHLIEEQAHEAAANTAGLLERMMSGGQQQDHHKQAEQLPTETVDPVRIVRPVIPKAFVDVA